MSAKLKTMDPSQNVSLKTKNTVIRLKFDAMTVTNLFCMTKSVKQIRVTFELLDDDKKQLGSFDANPIQVKIVSSYSNNGFAKTSVKCDSKEVFNSCTIQLIGSDLAKIGHISLRGPTSQMQRNQSEGGQKR